MIIKSHSGGQGVCARLYATYRGQVLGGVCYPLISWAAEQIYEFFICELRSFEEGEPLAEPLEEMDGVSPAQT